MNLSLPLWPYQEEGVTYAAEKKRTFIADDLGLGKSVQAFATVLKTGTLPALIVCPAYVKEVWAAMVQMFGRGVGYYVVDAKCDRIPQVPITIINYDILERFESQLARLPFKSVIFDESQYLKNRKAKRTKCAKRLSKQCEVVLCLSATPIESRPSELASQLDVLRRLPEFGGEWWFKQRYAVTHKPWCLTNGVGGVCECGKNRFGYWDFSGASNLKELGDRLRRTCLIRRTKEEVQKYLPELRREIIPVSITNAREYLEARSDFIKWIAERDGAEAAMRAYRAEAITKMNALKQLAVEGKISTAEQWIADACESGPLVVFLWHHKTSAALVSSPRLAHMGVTPVIDGDNSPERRASIVSSFQAGAFPLLLVNIRSGGLGIDLTRASNCLFIEQGWTPAEHDQAEGRLHRHGQSNAVTAWYMLATGTIDSTIYNLIGKKRRVVSAVLGTYDGVQFTGGGEFDVQSETARTIEEEEENIVG